MHSVNSVFCNLGQELGAKKILRTAKRFGFYELPPLETPANERRASGLYKNGRPFEPKRDFEVDAGRMAFGQERMLVTPLQMAMVAGTIGNGGILMEPHVVDRIVSPKGRVVYRGKATKIDRAVTPATARDVGAMMVAVVQRGTGTAAQLPGYAVGGKTGTAETGRSRDQPHLVHRLRRTAGPEAQDRRRRGRREPAARHGRPRLRADRQGRDGGTPAQDAEITEWLTRP